MDGDVPLRSYGHLRRHWLGFQRAARLDDGVIAFKYRSIVHVDFFDHWLILGQTDMGTWWAWDARITSTLILLFLYIGFISLQSAIDDPRRADRAGAVLAIVGVINVPIIYFSVQWWNTLHQGATIRLLEKPKMTGPTLAAMFIMRCLLALFDSCGAGSAAVHYFGKRTECWLGS